MRSIQGREGLFCIKVDEDRYRRDIVKCSVQTKNGIKDVGSIMVEEGYALAYRQYSKEYIEEEKRAKDKKKGIWKSRFIYPWEWRRELRIGRRVYGRVGLSIHGNGEERTNDSNIQLRI